MNVNDLYYNIFYGDFNVNNFEFNPDDQNLFGFIACDRDYMHASLPDRVVHDIVDNDAKYIKCIYYDNAPREIKTTLSVFTRMNFRNGHLQITPIKFKGDVYNIGSGIIMDNNNNVLFSVCKNRDCNNTIVVSPDVFGAKTTMNKYIISKIIPEFALNGMEVTIKDQRFILLNTGIRSGMNAYINNISDAYRFCEVES